MRVFVATKNLGKLRELQAIFAPFGWRLESYSQYVDVPEDADSYEGNAALKAEALVHQLLSVGIDAPTLGDDSGIEVNALDGGPGVLSARYGGRELSWSERRATLLREVAASGNPDRGARFVCVLYYIAGDSCEYSGRGEVEGRLTLEERGSSGFGYDPIFEFPPGGKTFAELSEEEKNAVSHRARAALALVDAVKAGRRQ